MSTILKVNLHDLDRQFFHDLEQKMPDPAAEVEIRIADPAQPADLFSDREFWQVIDALDGSQADSEATLAPAVQLLAAQPVVNIYLFADRLAEKLHQLDTRQHGDAYLAAEGDDYLSVDDFLYVRCAVVAEGQSFFEEVLHNPAAWPHDLSFESLLSLPAKAYEAKTGRPFDYFAPISYETYANKDGWK